MVLFNDSWTGVYDLSPFSLNKVLSDWGEKSKDVKVGIFFSCIKMPRTDVSKCLKELMQLKECMSQDPDPQLSSIAFMLDRLLSPTRVDFLEKLPEDSIFRRASAAIAAKVHKNFIKAKPLEIKILSQESFGDAASSTPNPLIDSPKSNSFTPVKDPIYEEATPSKNAKTPAGLFEERSKRVVVKEQKVSRKLGLSQSTRQVSVSQNSSRLASQKASKSINPQPHGRFVPFKKPAPKTKFMSREEADATEKKIQEQAEKDKETASMQRKKEALSKKEYRKEVEKKAKLGDKEPYKSPRNEECKSSKRSQTVGFKKSGKGLSNAYKKTHHGKNDRASHSYTSNWTALDTPDKEDNYNSDASGCSVDTLLSKIDNSRAPIDLKPRKLRKCLPKGGIEHHQRIYQLLTQTDMLGLDDILIVKNCLHGIFEQPPYITTNFYEIVLNEQIFSDDGVTYCEEEIFSVEYQKENKGQWNYHVKTRKLSEG